jgi:hypothetical protein
MLQQWGLLDPRPGKSPPMIAKKNKILGTTAHDGQIAVEHNLTKGMDRGQSIGVDEYLVNIRAVWLQFVDQLVGRATVKVSIEAKMNAVFVLKLENFEVHGHRLPSFLTPVSGKGVEPIE